MEELLAPEEEEMDMSKVRDPRTQALLIPLGSDLSSTIRLRREQLCDVLELLAELLCANNCYEESKVILTRAVDALRCVETTVSKISSNSLIVAFDNNTRTGGVGPQLVVSRIPPLRWASTLTTLGMVS